MKILSLIKKSLNRNMGSGVACSRLSVIEDDRKSERAASRISCERDPGVKRRGRESLEALF